MYRLVRTAQLRLRPGTRTSPPQIDQSSQFERGVVLRFGQLRAATRGPGLTLITPIADRLHEVKHADRDDARSAPHAIGQAAGEVPLCSRTTIQ
jgi:hypothetical protein